MFKNKNSFRVAFVTAVIVFIVVHFVPIPFSVPDFRSATNNGVMLDMRPAFSPDEVYDRLESYGESGRQNYFWRLLTVDIIFPLSLWPFLHLLALRASRLRWLPFFASGFLVFDVIENVIIATLLATLPMRIDQLASVLPLVTITKRLCSVVALIVPLVMMGWKKVSSSRV
jgi:hypothetical protein